MSQNFPVLASLQMVRDLLWKSGTSPSKMQLGTIAQVQQRKTWNLSFHWKRSTTDFSPLTGPRDIDACNYEVHDLTMGSRYEANGLEVWADSRQLNNRLWSMSIVSKFRVFWFSVMPCSWCWFQYPIGEHSKDSQLVSKAMLHCIINVTNFH